MTSQTRGAATGLHYAVDIVMCIDSTASMAPTLANVKSSALSFPNRLAQEMSRKGRGISSLRLKVVAFRDFGDRADDALVQSRFFTVPDDLDDFERAVRALTPDGGGDWPESGLEALAVAMASEWETGLDRRRHVVVVFTDAPAHPLGQSNHRSAAGYPSSIPSSLEDLMTQWGYGHSRNAIMENSAKRLLLFAPEEYPWSAIADDWNHTLFFPSEAGEGLKEWEMDEIIATIANSL